MTHEQKCTNLYSGKDAHLNFKDYDIITCTKFLLISNRKADIFDKPDGMANFFSSIYILKSFKHMELVNIYHSQFCSTFVEFSLNHKLNSSKNK